jgi:hypothetical protein
MAKETSPQTYRVSVEVDAELRRRAQLAGGIDKALRELLFMPFYSQTPPSERQPEQSVDMPVKDGNYPLAVGTPHAG